MTKPVLLFMSNLGGSELLLIMLVIGPLGLLIHFLPTLIGRKRPDVLVIFLVNLLAGWSIIGWFAALYLALRQRPTYLPTAPGGPVSVADELTKLQALRTQGVLTAEEFERQKNNLLS